MTAKTVLIIAPFQSPWKGETRGAKAGLKDGVSMDAVYYLPFYHLGCCNSPWVNCLSLLPPLSALHPPGCLSHLHFLVRGLPAHTSFSLLLHPAWCWVIPKSLGRYTCSWARGHPGTDWVVWQRAVGQALHRVRGTDPSLLTQSPLHRVHASFLPQSFPPPLQAVLLPGGGSQCSFIDI